MHHSIWKIILVLGAYVYLKRQKAKIRKFIFFYVKIFLNNSVFSNECFRFTFHCKSMAKIQYFLLSDALLLLRFSCCHKQVEALQFIEVIQVGWFWFFYNKVQIFWEDHKNDQSSTYYWTLNKKWKLGQILVAFSE